MNLIHTTDVVTSFVYPQILEIQHFLSDINKSGNEERHETRYVLNYEKYDKKNLSSQSR